MPVVTISKLSIDWFESILVIEKKHRDSFSRDKVHILIIIEPRHEKTNVLVSDLVRHKPGCIATEDGKRLEISDLERRGIALSV